MKILVTMPEGHIHAETFIREIHSHTRNTACRIEYLWGETENLAERLIHKIEQDYKAHPDLEAQPDYEAHPLERLLRQGGLN